MRILAVVNLRDYASFHRRPHYEAIRAAVPGFELLCVTQFADPRSRRVAAASIPTNTVPKLFPAALKRAIPGLRFVDQALVRIQVRRLLTRFDVLHVASPHDVQIARYRTTQLLVYELYDPHAFMGISSELERQLVQQSDAVLATARGLIADYLPRFDPRPSLRTFYWPNAVDSNHWQRRMLGGTAPMTVGFLGNINSITFDPDLFDAITAGFPHVRFEVAGRVNYTNFTGVDVRRTSELLQRDNVKFLGFIPYDRVPEIVRRWDVGILVDPISELSTFIHHNKIYQYLAVGLPVVASRAQPDYETLGFPVFLASSAAEFTRRISDALAVSRKSATVDAAISLANRNSCAVRAHEYREILRGLLKDRTAAAR